MNAQQAYLAQCFACGFVLYMVISCLVLIWQWHVAKAEPEPYNVVEDAERVLYGYQQRTEVQ